MQFGLISDADGENAILLVKSRIGQFSLIQALNILTFEIHEIITERLAYLT